VSAKQNVGIIGCGAVVQKNYVKALSLYTDICIAHVHDLNSSAAEKVSHMTGASVSSLEVIKADCDIVIIATPPSSHAELVENMMVSGRTVICEKPFVGRKCDAEHLDRLSAERNCNLFVAHFRRCFPSVRLARSLVESGILGAVIEVSAYEGGRFSWEAESGYVYKDPYGGVLFDTGSHTIDMLLHVACLDGNPLEVAATIVKRNCPEPSHDLEARVCLSGKGREIKGHLKFSRLLATANKIRVDCEHGFVEIPVGMVDYVRLGKRDGSSVIVRARESYDDLMDCFALQFKHMFYPDAKHTFAADKFINLTAVLETVSKA
jgi:predicted dehydrogenase